MEEKNFFERVYEVARQIPKGKVTSYGAIAKSVGAAKSARMVGYAMNSAKDLDDVPAHRVVNRNGLLTGKSHFGDHSAMQQMLTAEGITVKDNKVQDFEKHFWDPQEDFR
ncbi:MGMT family protein [Salegentibacter salegens]|uniref:Methylated-DNA-protein-cysteine methyltransferase related protein n=1 Tax=Salegentibacter salegens TaxID=143223 RepID=A0A1M7LSQ1_9FLAO|nr:MGMT family protein [Salegentibacter salegens]PRX52197.1 methylated-DNA-protein-cysteine methyltransferase-like protein [Salegentibacter salegens]SHM81296.1 methylated-DNA-protein-cysteine methyltransferase related protein [Salegentibacter salegens]